MSDAILFSRCLGLNDHKSTTVPITNPSPRSKTPGATEVIACRNVTTTADGALENVPALVPVITHGAAITNVSAMDRFMFQDGTDTYEWTGPDIFTRGAVLDGPVCHTPLDVRVSTLSAVYKSLTGSAFQAATVGVNPGPVTSKPFYAMPAFDGAWFYNDKLYLINHANPRFIQYSREGWHYDLWPIGDNFIENRWPILQGGAINAVQPGQPGGMCLMHANGIVTLTGSGAGQIDLIKNDFLLPVLTGTLYSGYISKAQGVGHVFLATDGVYMVNEAGGLDKLTGTQLNYLNTLNTIYYGAIVADGKYLAYGDNVCVEFDFVTKSVLLRDSGVVAATMWKNTPYLAYGSTVSTFAASSSTVASMVQFPFSDLGTQGAKYISDLYFTGEINGETTITATDDMGQSWTDRWEIFGKVNNYRLKTPRGKMGAKVSFTIECATGPFRMEQLRAVFSTSRRSK